MPRPARRCLLALVALVTCAATAAGQTPADRFEADMGNGSLWVLVPDGDKQATRVLHHPSSPADAGLVDVQTLSGRVAPGGIAAVRNELWVVYADGLIHTLRFDPGDNPRTTRPGVYSGRLRGRLPAGVTLMSLAAGNDGPWALVRIESRAALTGLEQQTEERNAAQKPRERWIPGISEYGYDRDKPNAAAPSKSETTGQTETDGEPAEDSTPDDAEAPGQTDTTPTDETAPDEQRPSEQFEDEVFLPVDRLLRWSRRGWTVVDLPEDWPGEARGFVTLARPGADAPDLLTVPADVGGVGVWVYRWRDGAWQKTDYPDVTLHDGAMHAVGIDGQLVLAQQHSPGRTGRLVVEATLLRGGQATPLGLLAPGVAADRPWRVAGRGDRVTVIARDTSPPSDGARPDEQDAAQVAEGSELEPPVAVKLASVGLDGRDTGEPVTLVEEPMSWDQAPGQLLLMAVFLLSTVMLFVFWQRDREGKQVALPRGVALAEVSKRVLAGVVDLLPCVVLSFLAFGVSLAELPERWPGLMGEVAPWGTLMPGLVAIGLFVLHTMVGELIVQKSLGKWLLGLRVATLTGGVPRPWQIVARNLLKTFDLVALPLLLLPLIGPFGQRLGDLVASTVIVGPATEQDSEYEDDPDA